MELNFTLHDAQLEIYNDPARFKVVAAGRRFGKSFLSAIVLILEALKAENEFGYKLSSKHVVYYVAPTFQQAKDIMWALLKELGRPVIKTVWENTGKIELVNGRFIMLKGADRPDNLRGVGLSFVVLDEYAFMKPDVWELIIRPMLTDVKGGALFIGTPDGKNHFYDLYLENLPDPDWGCFTFKSVQNEFLDKDEIEVARKNISTEAYKQEYEASFASFEGKIFKSEWVKISSTEPADGSFFMSVDPAGFEDVAKTKSKNSRLDETAISVVKVGSEGWYVKDIIHGRWGVRETSLRILRAAQKYGVMCIGIEKGSLKNALMPYLEDQMRRLNVYPRVEETTHGGQKKTERITWALQGRLEHGRIVLAPGEWNRRFEEQLVDFPNPLTHDDLIDSLAYIDQISQAVYMTELIQDSWEPFDELAGY